VVKNREIPTKSVKKWCGFRVVLMKNGEKKGESEKKLQKVKENIWLAQRREGGQEADQLTVGS
jgi:hypothetical protein